MGKFHRRQQKHDRQEHLAMLAIRKHTVRKHMPDRWISFRGELTPWDYKTNIFVEDNSHDEYFRLLQEGYRMFVVYRNNRRLYANWIDALVWDGPKPASAKSTSGDPYYILSGGIPLKEFLKRQA